MSALFLVLFPVNSRLSVIGSRMHPTRSPTPTPLNEQHIWGGYTYPGTVGLAQDASGGLPLSQQGIIASDSDSLFHPVHTCSPSQPYSLPNVPHIPIHHQNTAYIQPFSHIPINRDHLSLPPPPSFHTNPVSSYNNSNFTLPPLSSSVQTPVQYHQVPFNNFSNQNQNQQQNQQQNQPYFPCPPYLNQPPVQYVLLCSFPFNSNFTFFSPENLAFCFPSSYPY